MTRNKKTQKLMIMMLYLIPILSTIPIDVIAQDNEPQFGSDIAIIKVEDIVQNIFDEQTHLHYELSSSGHYVVGRILDPVQRHLAVSTILYVWEIEDITAIEAFDPVNQKVIEPSQSAGFAISPDEQYVAVEVDNYIQILTLPDLELFATQPISSADSTYKVYWHPTGNLLAIKQGSRLIVWDVVSNDVYERTFDDMASFSLIVAKFGWILDPISSSTFYVCGILIEDCTRYEIPTGRFLAFNESRQLIMSSVNQFSEEFPELVIWTYEDGTAYSIDVIQPSAAISLTGRDIISPDGNYIFSYDHKIWDRRTWEIANSLVQTDYVIWMPSDNYFIAVNGVDGIGAPIRIYRLGQEHPVDAFDIQTIPELKWIFDTTSQTHETSPAGITQLNPSGTEMLADLGWIAIIVSIEYEKEN